MGDILASVWNGVKAFFLIFKPLGDFIVRTGVPDQIENVKYKELFSNGWFLVPYLGMIAWNIYKKQLKTIIVILLFSGSWAFFGTPYMHNIMTRDEVTLDAILPLVGGAVVVLGIIIYLVFLKSE
jgi:hypothetical protein